jgi:hypothetical protein
MWEKVSSEPTDNPVLPEGDTVWTADQFCEVGNSYPYNKGIVYPTSVVKKYGSRRLETLAGYYEYYQDALKLRCEETGQPQSGVYEFTDDPEWSTWWWHLPPWEGAFVAQFLRNWGGCFPRRMTKASAWFVQGPPMPDSNPPDGGETCEEVLGPWSDQPLPRPPMLFRPLPGGGWSVGPRKQ